MDLVMAGFSKCNAVTLYRTERIFIKSDAFIWWSQFYLLPLQHEFIITL